MSQNFAALFADDAPRPSGGPSGPSAEFFTDEPEAAPTTAETTSPKKSKAQDRYLDLDGLEVAEQATARRWAAIIEDRHAQLEVRQIASVGHPANPYGCWAIERWSADKGGGGFQRLRYADNLQLREIYLALGDGTKFWELVYGEGLPGPYRIGRPPVNAKGEPLTDDVPDRGDHGPLPDECAWIEAHDETFVRYAGEDPVWPNGCFVVEKVGCKRQLCDAAQVKYIAHDILGMPAATKQARTTKLHRAHSVEFWDTRPAQTQAAGNGLASLFADEETEAQPAGIAALFAD